MSKLIKLVVFCTAFAFAMSAVAGTHHKKMHKSMKSHKSMKMHKKAPKKAKLTAKKAKVTKK